jgi:hypothetical protein
MPNSLLLQEIYFEQQYSHEEIEEVIIEDEE